jgi:hypothetical protein
LPRSENFFYFGACPEVKFFYFVTRYIEIIRKTENISELQ